jgi:hypothetical protein
MRPPAAFSIAPGKGAPPSAVKKTTANKSEKRERKRKENALAHQQGRNPLAGANKTEKRERKRKENALAHQQGRNPLAGANKTETRERKRILQ